MSISQTDLFSSAATSGAEGITESDQCDFRSRLMVKDWQSREEMAQALGWSVRKVRAVAQSLGGDVIRCQAGYKLTILCDRDDIPRMTQAADASGSQAAHMRAYELSVRRAIHIIVG